MQTIEAFQAECPVVAGGANCRFMGEGRSSIEMRPMGLAEASCREFGRGASNRSPKLEGDEDPIETGPFERAWVSFPGSIVAAAGIGLAALRADRIYLEDRNFGGFDS